jgi:hypothetical protein
VNAADLPTTEALLDILRERFYPDQHRLFHRDRRMLLYALTWPAHWLDQRGLATAPHTYRQILTQRLDAIQIHGNPDRYLAYFPAYLLKSLQDWFVHHGEDLYDQLKHIRNACYGFDALLAPCQSPAALACSAQQAHIHTLAQAHRILRPIRRIANAQPRRIQLELWSNTPSR